MRKVAARLTLVAAALAFAGVATGAGPVNLFDGGNLHESVGQAGGQELKRGVTYTARTFPLALTVRPSDDLWGGVQLQSKQFRFVQFHHKRAGPTPLHGWGFVTIEASTGRTPTPAATIARLHATPLLKAGPLKPVRVAGFRGKAFDATVVGVDPGNTGISLTPFTTPRHCGFCEDTLNGETLDNKFAGKGQLFRIIVLGVRGKTVVIYLESSFGDSTTRKHPPTKTFPTFLPFAQRLLSTLAFPR